MSNAKLERMSSDSVSTASASDSDSCGPSSQYEHMSREDLEMLLSLRGMDVSHIENDRSKLVEEAIKGDGTCYDEAAKEVMAYVKNKGKLSKEGKHLNSIWQHSTTGAKVYVGNAKSAANKRLLKRKKIYAVVNCQDLTSENYHQGDSKFSYHRFPVTHLAMNKKKQFNSKTGEGAYDAGFRQANAFIEEHLRKKSNVLIHCTAGAHRAGTVGVAWLMKQEGLGCDLALQRAKKDRPIIQPFGLLLGLLHFLEMDLQGGPQPNSSKLVRRASMKMEEKKSLTRTQSSKKIVKMTRKADKNAFNEVSCL